MATLTRAQLAAALHAQLASLAAEVRQSATDDSALGYGPDIDAALARMAVDEISELTTWPQVGAVKVIARFYALTRFATRLATRVDTDQPYAVEGDRETIFEHVEALIKLAAAEALSYGYVLLVTNLSQTGSANQPVDQDDSGSAWGRDAFQTEWMVPSDVPLESSATYGEFL